MNTSQNMSELNERSDTAPPESLDHIIRVADAALVEGHGARRPQHVLDQITRTCNVGPEHRLAYRSQPNASQIKDFGPEILEFAPDLSLHFFLHNGAVRMSDETKEALSAFVGTLHGVHWSTFMDAASLLSPSCPGETVERAANFIESMVEELQKPDSVIWLREAEPTNDLADQMGFVTFNNCMSYAFIQRLMFYDARLNDDSLAKYRADLAKTCIDTELLEGFNIHEELDAMLRYHQRELDRMNDPWAANVELEWSGSLIPIEDVSTPIQTLQMSIALSADTS